MADKTDLSGEQQTLTLQQAIDIAVQHHNAGDLTEAESIYKQILEADSNQSVALNLLGVLNHQKGDNGLAVDLIKRSIRINPTYAEAYSNLGKILNDLGQFEEADFQIRKAIELRPDFVDALLNLGVSLKNIGKRDDAIIQYRNIINIEPNHLKANYELGSVLYKIGELEEAISCFKKVLRLDPDFVIAHNDLGVALMDHGQKEEAVISYQKALALNPNYSEAYGNLGVAFVELGQLEEGIASYNKAIAINPNFAEAHYNLGAALQGLGRLDEAVTSYRNALEKNPNYADAYNNLGTTLMELGRDDEALELFEKAVAIRPEFAEAYNNLGNVLQARGLLHEAVLNYKKSLATGGDKAEVYNNFGITLMDQGKLDEALKYLQKGLELDPDSAQTHSTIICCFNYMSSVTQSRILQESKEWERRHVLKKMKPYVMYANDRSLTRRLKIGYISPDFREHSVSYFAEPLIASHDRTKVESFCYANLLDSDETTERIKTYSDHWRWIKSRNDFDTAKLIYDDQIDILVDWAGHTKNNRLQVMAYKPAPVQVTWHGHLNTTGLKSIDYRFTDAVADPRNEVADQYSENLYHLPDCTYCYAGPLEVEKSIDIKYTSSGITFGSFNTLRKITENVLDLWAKVLIAVPDARLVLKNRSFACESTSKLYYEKFRNKGIGSDRIDMLGQVISTKSHLELYSQIDVALDTFPFNGATTTCEALWMGVPVLTLSGNRHVSRVGATMLNAIGLSEMIALDENEYIQKAVLLASEPIKLYELRKKLREAMKNSPLCDSNRFARQIEAAYRDMWQRWCSTNAM